MKVLLAVAVASITIVAASAAQASEELAKSSGCLACHAVDTKKMGPAFKDVAAKYKGKADAEAKLVAEVGGGKGHPTTKAKPEDVPTLIKWVLSLK
jgi:cytochrome c